MNNAYKLVYSAALNAWVAVAEHVRGRGKQGAVRLIAVTALLAGGVPSSGLALAAPPGVTQLPTGVQAAAGAVSISQTQTATAARMAITQTSKQAIVNWQSFNVGANAQVHITQPSSTSVLLNRVQSSDPSQLFGQIKANGQVFLTNPSGVYFAPGSSVDVGSFTASTHSISDSDFLSGNYHFKRNGATGSIINQGSITAGLGGYIALLAPGVVNQGAVVAQVGGTVAMSAGEGMQLQFNANNQLTNVLVTPSTIQALVDNGNAVQAPGGLIILSAQAANGLLGGVVKNSGAISATGLVNHGGTVRLSASHKIELTPASRILADAAQDSTGKGGRIDIIADLSNAKSSTQVNGTLSARGGDLGGDGGFIETSAVNLNIAETTRVSTLAPLGKAGEWLLDPNDFTVADAGGNLSTANLVTALNSNNVTITTTAGDASCTSVSAMSCGVGTAGNGDITIANAINGWTTNRLTLSAYRNVNINASITGTGNSSLYVHSGTSAATDYLGSIYLNANITTGEAPTTTVSGVVARGLGQYFTGYINGAAIKNAQVVLGANVTLSATNSDAVFYAKTDSSVGNQFGLTVNNGFGATKLLGGVGLTTALGSLSLGGTGQITFAGDIYTTGSQSYSGPVSLFAITSRDFLLKTTNSKVEFLSAVDAADQNFSGETLTIDNGSGNANFVGPVGSILPLGSLTITGLSNNPTAQTTTLSADIKTNNSQTYGGNVKLNANLSLSTWQNGDVLIAGNVDTTIQSSLLFQFLGGGSYSYSSDGGASFYNYVAAGNSSYGASGIAGFGAVSYDSSGSGTYSWTPSSTMQASYLAIGGGGSGGGRTGGGGGAGGVQTGNADFIAASPYSIVIGAGGVIPAAVAGSSRGVSGGSSTLSGSGVSVSALGGGGGGFNDATGRTGLAGGSGGGSSDRPSSGINTIGGAGTAGQGNNGGTSSSWGGNYGAGGGGGAGSVGQNGSDAAGGAGGGGIVNPIAGSTVGQNVAGTYYLAGGGGGGSFGPLTAGGLGGGGSATGDGTTAMGLANTGGGGGGSKFNGSSSGAGGSGAIVINGSVNHQFSLSISTGSGKTSIAGSVANVSDLSIASTHSDSQVTGSISGAANVVKSGAGGVLKLAGNNIYTGVTILNGGALNLGSFNAIGSSGTIIFGGGTLQFSANNYSDYSARFSTAAGQDYRIDTNGRSVTLTSALTSSGGSLTKLGNGVLTLAGNSTYSGGTNLYSGALNLGSVNAIGSTGAISFGGGALMFSAVNTTDYSARFSTAANQNYRINTNNQSVTLATGLTSPGGTLTKLAMGTLTLTGENTYDGGTTISAGMLQVGSGSTAGSVVGNLVNNSSLVFSRSNPLTFSGAISGTGSLTKSGAGTLILTGTHTYSGGTTISAGTLQLGSGSTAGGMNGNVSNSGVLAFDRSDALTFLGYISGAGSVSHLGAGTTTLAGTNTYTGSTSVSAGTLKVGSVGALGTAGVSVASSGVLDLNGYSIDNALSLGGGSSVGALTNSSVTAVTASGNMSLVASSSIGGAGDINLSGAITSNGHGLALVGAGSKTLSSTANTLSTIATGAGVGALSVNNNAALEIGQVTTGGSTYSGIDATGTVTVITRTDDLTVSQNVFTTSTSAHTAAPALKLSAADGTAAGTSSGGNVVLAGSPALSVGAGGIAVVYSGDPFASSGVGTLISSQASNFSLYSKSTANANLLTAAGYYALYRASGVPIYVSADTGQSSFYGTAPVLSYSYSSSATSVVPVVYAGIPATAQTYFLASGAVSNTINVASGVTGTLALTGSPSITATGLVGTTHAGTYALTLTPTLNLAGYIFSAGNAVNYTINPKPITVTSASRTTTYDGVATYTHLTTTTPFSNTAMEGTDVLASVTQSATPMGVAQAGSFNVTPSSAVIGTGSLGNYSFSYAQGTHAVSPAPLTVRAANASKSYDGATYTGGNGVEYVGWVNGETAALLSGTVTYTGTSQGARNAGSYSITPSGLSSRNYEVSFADGSLTVTPAPMTLTAVTNTKSFDGNTIAQALPTVAGLQGLDTVSNLSENYADPNPGTGKSLTVGSAYVIQDGNGGRNYVVAAVPDASGVIRALPVAVLPPSIALSSSDAVIPTIRPDLGMTTNSAAAISTAVSFGSSGVTVSMVNQATQQTPGLVAVLVPSGSSTRGTGLRITLPESVFASNPQAEIAERVTLPDQRPLPAWIRYDAANRTLVTGAVPEGAFPITVWVTLGGQVTVVQISETQAKL